MKITLCGSISFLNEMLELKEKLEKMGHEVKLPPAQVAQELEQLLPEHDFAGSHKSQGEMDDWVKNRKGEIMRDHLQKVEWSDAILVVNRGKSGVENYIGGNALIEMAVAYYLSKKIFLMSDIPEMVYREEILGMNPTILHEDLTKIT
jgi:hypothetical protein